MIKRNKYLPEPIEFEWDKGNREKNWVKHKVTTAEAEEVFLNKPLIIKDEKHSGIEKRYAAFGKSNNQRFLAVSFTLRGNKIRIISVRDISKKERSNYVRHQTNSRFQR